MENIILLSAAKNTMETKVAAFNETYPYCIHAFQQKGKPCTELECGRCEMWSPNQAEWDQFLDVYGMPTGLIKSPSCGVLDQKLANGYTAFDTYVSWIKRERAGLMGTFDPESQTWDTKVEGNDSCFVSCHGEWLTNCNIVAKMGETSSWSCKTHRTLWPIAINGRDHAIAKTEEFLRMTYAEQFENAGPLSPPKPRNSNHTEVTCYLCKECGKPTHVKTTEEEMNGVKFRQFHYALCKEHGLLDRGICKRCHATPRVAAICEKAGGY